LGALIIRGVEFGAAGLVLLLGLGLLLGYLAAERVTCFEGWIQPSFRLNCKPLKTVMRRKRVMLRSVLGRKHLAHVGGQLAIVQCEPEIQLALRPIRRQPSNHFAFGSVGLKSLQLGLKVDHGSLP
jgi:hypothetical protein